MYIPLLFSDNKKWSSSHIISNTNHFSLLNKELKRVKKKLKINKINPLKKIIIISIAYRCSQSSETVSGASPPLLAAHKAFQMETDILTGSVYFLYNKIPHYTINQYYG
ncbi:hypothetical protein ACOSQ2_011614 [Xanthoceras sorbifolium]